MIKYLRTTHLFKQEEKQKDSHDNMMDTRRELRMKKGDYSDEDMANDYI